MTAELTNQIHRLSYPLPDAWVESDSVAEELETDCDSTCAQDDFEAVIAGWDDKTPAR